MRRGSGPHHRPVLSLFLAGLCLLAGCSGLSGDGERTTYDVPDRTTTTGDPWPTPGGPVGDATVGKRGSAAESRYFGLRPNCDRPPSLVVAVQVGALRNTGARNRGLRTFYEFSAPGYRWALGPFPRFVRLIRSNYDPLLDAETVSFGRVERSNGTATMSVEVRTGDGGTANYQWRLQRQGAGPYDGCWMTSEVRNTTRPTIQREP